MNEDIEDVLRQKFTDLAETILKAIPSDGNGPLSKARGQAILNLEQSSLWASYGFGYMGNAAEIQAEAAEKATTSGSPITIKS